MVTSALVDGFSAAETQAVLGHELGHLVCEHSLWFSLGSIGSTLLPPLPGVARRPSASSRSGVRPGIFVRPCRAARDTGRRGRQRGAHQIGERFDKARRRRGVPPAGREYDEALEKSSRFVRTMQGRMLADATHPLPIRRVAELDRFARSAQ